MSIPAVEFSKVSKRFILRYDRPRSFQELLIDLPRGRGKTKEELWALKDVSFQVAKGEMLGIVGPNGAGKSTLLKLVARIVKPTSGRVRANGKVSSLLELGAGFHPDLTGRENIYLQGSILGLSRREMAGKFDEIVTFSELADFIDVPVRQYSSGMYLRLGFSVATSVDPDVLLVDEVLAVGDEAFQKRCLERIRRFRSKGKAILLVSHALDTVRDLCNSAIWLHEGEPRAHGNVDKVIDSYLNHVAAEEGTSLREHPEERRGRHWGSKEIEITKVTILDAEGQERHLFKTGEEMTIRMEYVAHEKFEDPVFGIAIHTSDGLLVSGSNTQLCGFAIETVEGRGVVECNLGCLSLLQGRYVISVSVYDRYIRQAYDHHDKLYGFSIGSSEIVDQDRGLLDINCMWRHGRGTQ